MQHQSEHQGRSLSQSILLRLSLPLKPGYKRIRWSIQLNNCMTRGAIRARGSRSVGFRNNQINQGYNNKACN